MMALKLLGVAVGIGGIYGALQASRHNGHRRACRPLWDMPEVPLDALVEGKEQRALATVLADDHELIEAPLTGRRCAAYSLQINALLMRGNKYTPTRAKEQTRTPLRVGAGGTVITVELEHAALWLGHLKCSPWHRAAPERRRAALDRNGFARSGNNGAWWEMVILPGDEVWVGGPVSRAAEPEAPGGERLYRDHLAAARFIGTRRNPVYVVAC
jgi:hypothetical protein